MQIISLYLLVAGLALAMTQGSNLPDFQIAFDYDIFNIFQNNYLAPLVAQKAQDFQLSELNISDITMSEGPASISVSNIQLSSLDVDWSNTNLLTPSNNLPTIQLQIASITVEFDCEAGLSLIKFTGDNNNITLEGLSLDISLGFDTLPNGTVYAYFDSVNVGLQNINTQLSEDIGQFVVNVAKDLGIKIQDIASDVIQQKLVGFNQTFIDMTSAGLSLDILNNLQVQLWLAGMPTIYDLNGSDYQTFAFNLEITNTETNETAPTTSEDTMPTYIEGGLPVQLFISENLISQLLWAGFQSGLVDLSLSQADIPSTLPLKLDTTDINVLFPNIPETFGQGKIMYAQALKGGDYPTIYIREGRLVTELSLEVNLFVNQDNITSGYGALENCTNCDLATSLNISAFVAVDLYQVNATFLGVEVMDAILNDIQVLDGVVEATNLSENLNNLVVPLLMQTNAQFADGVQNPAIGMMGLNATSIEISTGYLAVGLSIAS